MKEWIGTLPLVDCMYMALPPTAIGYLLLLNAPISQAPTLLPMYIASRYVFEDGTGFKIRFMYDIKTNKYFTDVSLIKRYEVPNLLLDDGPILKNITGRNIHWEKGSSLTYRGVKKKQRSNSSRR